MQTLKVKTLHHCCVVLLQAGCAVLPRLLTMLPPAPARVLGQESAGTSSAQAFQNNNLASQFQEENNKVCFRKAASILGKHGHLCRNHAKHSAGCRRTIACCCEKPLSPAALGPKTNTRPSGCWRQPCSKALVLFVGRSPHARDNGLTWKDPQKCFLKRLVFFSREKQWYVVPLLTSKREKHFSNSFFF